MSPRLFKNRPFGSHCWLGTQTQDRRRWRIEGADGMPPIQTSFKNNELHLVSFYRQKKFFVCRLNRAISTHSYNITLSWVLSKIIWIRSISNRTMSVKQIRGQRWRLSCLTWRDLQLVHCFTSDESRFLYEECVLEICLFRTLSNRNMNMNMHLLNTAMQQGS